MYELVVIYKADIDLAKAEKDLRAMLQKMDGTVESVDWWGEKKLAYPIKERVIGSYCTYVITLAPQHVQELQRLMGFEEDVLRTRIYKPEN